MTVCASLQPAASQPSPLLALPALCPRSFSRPLSLPLGALLPFQPAGITSVTNVPGGLGPALPSSARALVEVSWFHLVSFASPSPQGSNVPVHRVSLAKPLWSWCLCSLPGWWCWAQSCPLEARPLPSQNPSHRSFPVWQHQTSWPVSAARSAAWLWEIPKRKQEEELSFPTSCFRAVW